MIPDDNGETTQRDRTVVIGVGNAGTVMTSFLKQLLCTHNWIIYRSHCENVVFSECPKCGKLKREPY